MANPKWKRLFAKNKTVRVFALVLGFLLLLFCAVISLGEAGVLPFSLPSWDDIFMQIGLEESPVFSLPEGHTVSVHFLDVGQGDSTLILAGETAVLIDAGERESGSLVCEYLKKSGVKKLDLVIATHPHADHIGGLPEVLESFETKACILPDIPEAHLPTTNTFLRLLDTLETKEIDVTPAQAGQKIFLTEQIYLEILAPVGEYENLNNFSVVSRLVAGECSFLFMGDAEKEVEADLLSFGSKLKSDVLKLGHHGSSTSSSKDFLDAVRPEIAVASCGVQNSYGHPHKEVVSRLAKRNISLYRTDLDKNIVISCDGKELSVHTQQKGENAA